MTDRTTLCALVLALLPSLALAQQQPLSASDWLSGSVRGPVRESSAWRPGDAPPPRPSARPQPVATSGAVGPVQVTRLDQGNPDHTGTQSPRRAGLPADLWSGSDPAQLSQMVLATPARLQSMQALLKRVLTAQLAPPTAPEGMRGQLFLSRADRLLDMGALDEAQSLLVAAGPGQPEIFRRMFDIALLEGDEGRACAIMNGTPGIAPSFAARIFCLAQTGDWAAAAIGLHGAEALGLIDERQAILLTHFLDDAFVDTAELLAPADRMTPLEFRIYEAVGQPLPTQPLPVAFAQSDLRLNSGFKARLEAAERLARTGALPATTLRQIYGEQRPRGIGRGLGTRRSHAHAGGGAGGRRSGAGVAPRLRRIPRGRDGRPAGGDGRGRPAHRHHRSPRRRGGRPDARLDGPARQRDPRSRARDGRTPRHAPRHPSRRGAADRDGRYRRGAGGRSGPRRAWHSHAARPGSGPRCRSRRGADHPSAADAGPAMSADHNAIGAFLDAQAAEAGAARNTLLAYGRDLRDLSDWLGARALSLAGLTREQVEDYLSHCDAQGLSRATRARRLSAIRQFTRFALEEGWREDDPAIRIAGPGRAKRIPRTLDRAEIQALLDAAPGIGRGRIDRTRNMCLIELLYATGMRVTELVSLPVAGCRGDPAVLVIRGKGGKDRMVPLGQAARTALRDWLEIRDNAPPGQPAVPPAGGSRRALAVSRTGRGGPPAAAELFAPAGPDGGGGGHRSRARDAARDPPRLCHPPAGRRRRPAQHPDAAGPCRSGHDGNLYSCAEPSHARSGSEPPPSGARRVA
ncbi:tyrosine-type recombinase/integrase [Paracoccus sp. NBH48]|nr:tyrosine-type recombinase/integrase [Paracoccus sp. NBH48]